MIDQIKNQEELLERISKLPASEKQLLVKMYYARQLHKNYIDPNMHVRNLLGIKEQK